VTLLAASHLHANQRHVMTQLLCYIETCTFMAHGPSTPFLSCSV